MSRVLLVNLARVAEVIKRIPATFLPPPDSICSTSSNLAAGRIRPISSSVTAANAAASTQNFDTDADAAGDNRRQPSQSTPLAMASLNSSSGSSRVTDIEVAPADINHGDASQSGREEDVPDRRPVSEAADETDLDQHWSVGEVQSPASDRRSSQRSENSREQDVGTEIPADSQHSHEIEYGLDAAWTPSDLEDASLTSGVAISQDEDAPLFGPFDSDAESNFHDTNESPLNHNDNFDSSLVDAPSPPASEEHALDSLLTIETDPQPQAESETASADWEDLLADVDAVEPDTETFEVFADAGSLLFSDAAEEPPLDFDVDDYLDPSELPELDPDARAGGPSVATATIRAEERRQQLARALAHRHGWFDEADVAILEEIVTPMRRLGASLRVLDEIMDEGITPDELDAARRLRQLWRMNAMWIETETKRKGSSQIKDFSTLTWRQSWQISRALGCDLDNEELQWTLDRLRDDWYERYQEQQQGYRRAFRIGDTLASFVLERLGNADDESPFWGNERWIGQADLHDLYRAEDPEETEGSDLWI